MALLDDNEESPGELLADIAEEALKPPQKNDPDEPRAPVWLKWMQFGALIIGPALVFGLAFAFGDYLMQLSTQHPYSYQQERAERAVQHDSISAMKWRFIIGAGVGGALGAVYVVRCVIRKVDP